MTDERGQLGRVDLDPLRGSSVTNLTRPIKRVVAFYNQRGTAEQYIKEGKNASNWTRLSCHGFRNNEVRLQLHVLAYNMGNFLRTLALPDEVEHWSMTTLRDKLIKIGAKVVRHGRYVTACRGRDSTATVRGNSATDRRPAAEASTDMTPCVSDAVGLNRRAPGLATCRRAVFSPPNLPCHGLGCTERPMRSRDHGLHRLTCDQLSAVTLFLMLGRSQLGNPRLAQTFIGNIKWAPDSG